MVERAEANGSPKSPAQKKQSSTDTPTSPPDTPAVTDVAVAPVVVAAVAPPPRCGKERLLLAEAVKRLTNQTREGNTAVAYDPKTAEYYAYCDHEYGHAHVQSRYTVTQEKLFDFLFYHAFRNKYPVGGSTRKNAHGFKPLDYDVVRTFYAAHVKYQVENPTDEGHQIPDPDDPLGYDALNTYKAVVLNVWSEQAASNCNSTSWDLIFTARVKQLINLVRRRKSRIKRKNYAEKIDGDFTPFTSIGQVGNIEEQFWLNGKTARGCLPGLRNRYVFLQCYSGLLRSESMFLGELSDMVNIEYERRRDMDAYEILVLQIATGKSFLFVDCRLNTY